MTVDDKIAQIEQDIQLHQKQARAFSLAQRAIIVQLLKTLQNKQILSNSEAKELIQDAASSFVKPTATEMEAMAVGLLQAIDDLL